MQGGSLPWTSVAFRLKFVVAHTRFTAQELAMADLSQEFTNAMDKLIKEMGTGEKKHQDAIMLEANNILTSEKFMASAKAAHDAMKGSEESYLWGDRKIRRTRLFVFVVMMIRTISNGMDQKHPPNFSANVCPYPGSNFSVNVCPCPGGNFSVNVCPVSGSSACGGPTKVCSAT